MPPKLLERQYQSQAYKRHEDNLRKDFYKKTARFFERESELAKQFDTWNSRGTEAFFADRREKACREERLHGRREKLKVLLTKEDEQCKRELEELQKRRKRPSTEKLSLEELRQKLLEKRAEQSLYVPSACRRSLNYAHVPVGDTVKRLEYVDINGVNSGSRPTSRDSQKNQRISRSPSIERALYHLNAHNSCQSPRSTSALKSENCHRHRRYTAQDLCSLGETNIRPSDIMDQSISPSFNRSSPNLSSNNQQNDSQSNNNVNGCRTTDEIDNGHKEPESRCEQEVYNAVLQQSQSSSNGSTSNTLQIDTTVHCQSTTGETQNEKLEAAAGFSTTVDNHANNESPRDDVNCHRRKKMHNQEVACVSDANMSVQMYRYLMHNDLKQRILDLCKREHSFVVKQFWEEALRLREMRNDLILLRDKNIYENRDLSIDEATRRSGLNIIEAREILTNGREKMSESILYSDEAKERWKQWVREDDDLAKTEKIIVRDLLINELEKEWRHLALQDKNRLSHLYTRVMTKSDLQDEHKLAALIREANDCQRQYTNYVTRQNFSM